jgi:serine/threonine protein kinase
MRIAPGDQLGPYVVESELGAGGMGRVYRARDTRLQRPVAIKVLSSEIAGPSARHRFEKEAINASALNHPHILTVHETGETEGHPYLVTEFVDGGTLADWVRHTGIHVSRAGDGTAARRAQRHLLVRGGLIRAARGPPPVPWLDPSGGAPRYRSRSRP